MSALTVLSGTLAYTFYIARGDRLRRLLIQLFCAKVFLYFTYGIYFIGTISGHFLHTPLAWILLFINTPIFIAKIRLYMFIKNIKP